MFFKDSKRFSNLNRRYPTDLCNAHLLAREPGTVRSFLWFCQECCGLAEAPLPSRLTGLYLPFWVGQLQVGMTNMRSCPSPGEGVSRHRSLRTIKQPSMAIAHSRRGAVYSKPVRIRLSATCVNFPACYLEQEDLETVNADSRCRPLQGESDMTLTRVALLGHALPCGLFDARRSASAGCIVLKVEPFRLLVRGRATDSHGAI